MKIIFVQPYYKNIWEALGLAYIAGFCRKYYHADLNIKFFQRYFDSVEDILSACEDVDILAFSCTSPTIKEALYIAEKAKNINTRIKVVIGGWHVTALKDKFYNPYVDHIVIGEGEEAFLKIINGEKDYIVRGSKYDFISLSWPDRELIKNRRTIDLCESMNGLRTASFQANRGCPFSCSFCSEKIMTGKYHKALNPIRTRFVSDLLWEIKDVINSYKINYFKFTDATFDVSPDFVIEFCRYKMLTAFKDLKWECNIHASLANEEMFYWLRLAGCHQVNIGVESGSEAILRDIGKGLNLNIIRNVFNWSKKYGIQRRAFFILGMPNEGIEEIKMTENLIDEIQPEVVGFTLLCPYPGSLYYDHETMKDIDWSITDEYSNDFWKNRHFSNTELKHIQRRLTDKYSNNLCERQK